MKAIQVTEYGGPEALQYREVPMPEPQAHEARVRISAIGVNFIDVYHRTGRYPGKLPSTLGMEAAGIVDAVGTDVTEVQVGDRVAYAMHLGSYAQYAVVPAAKLVPVPSHVADQAAAGLLLQGMTAHYLSYSTYPIQRGDTVLVHAGAGGVGLLLTQIASNLGARVITTVSTEEKAELSRQAGADEVILYTQTDFEADVRRLTDGQGVHAVYDSIGKTTFDKSLNCLRPRGYMVLYGASSGPVPAFDIMQLAAKGSLFLTRPSLAQYTLDRQELLWRSKDLFLWMANGTLQLRIEHTYKLADATQAHRDLEGRVTTGKLVLLPE